MTPDDDLTRTVVMWTDRGTRSWPHRDAAMLVETFGESRARGLLETIRLFESDFFSSDAHAHKPAPLR